MSPSERYTAAAYLVVFVAVMLYVVIIASKLQRLEREVARLASGCLTRNVRPSSRTRLSRSISPRNGHGSPT